MTPILQSTPARRRRSVVGAGFALLALGASVLVSSAPSGAQAAEASEVPLFEIDNGPTDGTLDNGVSWTVNLGQPADGGYGTASPDGTHVEQLWTFDHVVDVEFTVVGIDNSAECWELPAGAQSVELNNHDFPIEAVAPEEFDSETDHPCANGVAAASGATRPMTGSSVGGQGPGATFRLDGVTSLSLWKYGSGGSGLSLLRVTYTPPVAAINGPVDGATIEEGSATTLDTACSGGTSTVIQSITINGDQFEPGASLADLEPGDYEIAVTCTDETGGSSDMVTSSFRVSAAPAASTTAPPTTASPTTASAELPRTGDEGTTTLSMIGTLIIGLGLAAVIGASALATRAYRPRHLR